MKRLFFKFYDANANEGGGDPTATIIGAIEKKFGNVVTKDELDKAIEKAASKTELDLVAKSVKVTEELAQKLNEKLGQINAGNNSQKAVSFDSAVSKAFGEQIEGIKEAVSKKQSYQLDLKAAGTMDFANNFPTADVAISDLRPGFIGLPNRELHIRQLLATGSTSTSNFVYMAETGGEGVPALWTNYATAKASIDRDFEEKTAPVRTIAGVLKIAKHMLDDLPGLQSFLQNRLAQQYLEVEDNAILYGPNDTAPNFTGLTVAATGAVSAAARTIDRIALTMAGLMANNYMPNGILVNPVTYTEMILSSFSTGGYSYPAQFNATTNQLTLMGVPVFPHPEMLVGKFLVGNWSTGAQLIVRQQPTIEIATQNEDDFRKNVIAIRVEGRIALPIYYPAGWSYGDKGIFSGS